LVRRDDTNRDFDVFVRDRHTGRTRRVSVSSDETQAKGFSGEGVAISRHGRFVAFDSDAANLAPRDTNRDTDVFLRDRHSGTTERVSVSSDEEQARGFSTSPAISGSGRFVAFNSTAVNLQPDRAIEAFNIYVRDRRAGRTRLISEGRDHTPANDGSGNDVTALSRDGSVIAFDSSATNLVALDTNAANDIFVSASGSP